VIDPQRGRAIVYRSLSDIQELGEEGLLDGEDVVPGFQCRCGRSLSRRPLALRTSPAPLRGVDRPGHTASGLSSVDADLPPRSRNAAAEKSERPRMA
jgi:hypothetical protein